MKTYPIKDTRYTIGKEYTGHISGKPRFVLRFCGDWVADSAFYRPLVVRAAGDSASMRGLLTVEEIRPTQKP